jgi:hypothetical protein
MSKNITNIIANNLSFLKSIYPISDFQIKQISETILYDIKEYYTLKEKEV